MKRYTILFCWVAFFAYGQNKEVLSIQNPYLKALITSHKKEKMLAYWAMIEKNNRSLVATFFQNEASFWLKEDITQMINDITLPLEDSIYLKGPAKRNAWYNSTQEDRIKIAQLFLSRLSMWMDILKEEGEEAVL